MPIVPKLLRLSCIQSLEQASDDHPSIHLLIKYPSIINVSNIAIIGHLPVNYPATLIPMSPQWSIILYSIMFCSNLLKYTASSDLDNVSRLIVCRQVKPTNSWAAISLLFVGSQRSDEAGFFIGCVRRDGRYGP